MANTYLTRTPTTENINKLTLSCWVKRGSISNNSQRIFSNPSSEYLFHRFETNDQFRFTIVVDGSETSIRTNRVFRDTSAWYHIVVRWDTTQATEADRIKLWVNGVQETSFNLATYPALNSSSDMFNSGTAFEIGRYSTGNNEYFDGSMSHLHCCSGYAYDASAFGQFDANGVWTINTSPSVTYGTNGFFILKNGNSVTDQSGNGNNFTVAGGTLTNTEDSPSNVFATLNPLVNNAGEMMALTKGNLTCESTTTSPAWKLAVSTLGMTSGKYYWEVKFDNVHNCYNTGIMGSNLLTANTSNIMSQIGYTGFYNNDGGEFRVDNTDTTVDYGLYNTGDIMGIACDMDNYTIAFYKNGVSHVSSQSISTTGRDIVFPCSIHYQTNGGVQASYNFGNGYFGTTAISSAGTNASGNGIFEYDVPTGYTALSTKGLNL